MGIHSATTIEVLTMNGRSWEIDAASETVSSPLSTAPRREREIAPEKRGRVDRCEAVCRHQALRKILGGWPLSS